MSVQLYAFECGRLEIPHSFLLEGAKGKIQVPIPTYGHTPGHQSLRVRTERGEFVLCGDACYLRHSLDHDHLPGVLEDRSGALRAFALFRKLEAAGARIMFGHDPEFWKTIPQAPARLA